MQVILNPLQAMHQFFLKHKAIHSFVLNIFLGVGKLFLGIYYTSNWFIITASYYIVLGIIRGNLLHREHSVKPLTLQDIRLIHRISGCLLILTGLIYFVLCLWMMKYQVTIQYPQFILYGVVTIAFYKITIAIYGFIKARKHILPMDGLVASITLLDACVSMVAVQCALLTMENSLYASSSSAYLGIFVSFIFLICGIYYLKK